MLDVKKAAGARTVLLGEMVVSKKEGDPSIDPKGTLTKLWEALISLNQYIPFPKPYIILLESLYNPYIPLFNPISL